MGRVDNIVDLLEAGVRGESLRQKAIASNIANIETPGYRRKGVRFEDLLTKAVDSKGQVKASEVSPEIYQPRQTKVKANGNDVSLEVEIGEMIKNALRQKTYIRLLSKKYRQIEAAIRTRD